jgi:transposase
MSQIQALDWTQPGLPLKKRRTGAMTHDYKRHGTTTLFAALNAIEAELPKDKAVHVILDNYATHKQPKARAWLARHPRWTFHFVPTSCSWLNAVEGFFTKLTRRRLKYGVFHSDIGLPATINRFVKEHNQEPKPLIWRADPDEIIAAVKPGHQSLESIHSHVRLSIVLKLYSLVY